MKIKLFTRLVIFACLVSSVSCATFWSKSPYEEVEVKNVATGRTTVCYKPKDSFLTQTDAKVNIEATYDVKATTKQALADIDPHGKLDAGVSSVTAKLRLISTENFDYMSFLFPFCTANGNGTMSDKECLTKMDNLLDRILRENVTNHPFEGRYAGFFSFADKRLSDRLLPENRTGEARIMIDKTGIVSGSVISITRASLDSKQTLVLDGLISQTGLFSGTYVLPSGDHYSLRGKLQKNGEVLSGSVHIDPGIGKVNFRLKLEI